MVGASNIDTDDSVRSVSDCFLNGNGVLRRGECPIQGDDQTGIHLRVFHHGAPHTPERRENYKIKVALSCAVAFHRTETELLQNKIALAISAADNRMYRFLDSFRG